MGGFKCPEHHGFRFVDNPRQRQHGPPPPCATAIQLAIDYFLQRNFCVEAFLPEWAMSGGKNRNLFAHEYQLLMPYIYDPQNPVVFTTPSGADDDKFILQRAKSKVAEGADVLVV